MGFFVYGAVVDFGMKIKKLLQQYKNDITQLKKGTKRGSKKSNNKQHFIQNTIPNYCIIDDYN